MDLITSTPILDKLREKGATFYTFSTAINDIDRCAMNAIVRMQPSKFVLCKLPNWANLENVQTLFYPPVDMGAEAGESPNLLFPKVIQNYMENMIQYANQEKIDASYESVAEMCWWKMLRKLNAFKTEIHETVTINNTDKYIYKEVADSEKYESVVKYIGDINILNNVSVKGQSYTEVMLYVPTRAGQSSGIRFCTGNVQYGTNEIPKEDNPNEYSLGMSEEDYAAKAIYDNEARKYEVATQEAMSGVYFDADTENTTNEFEFNCVLVYYDIWNTNDPNNTKCTNLMGVLFMNDFGTTSGSNTGTWPNYKKLSEIDEHSGNAYLFRINLKTVNKSTQVTSEITVNDSDTVSMQLYLEALEKVNDLNEMYREIFYKFNGIIQAFDNFTTLNAKYPDLFSLESRLRELERKVEYGADLNNLSSDDVLNMLRTTQQTIQSDPNAAVVINMFKGNPIVTSNGMFVVSPDGQIWKFNEESKTWETVSGIS